MINFLSIFHPKLTHFGKFLKSRKLNIDGHVYLWQMYDCGDPYTSLQHYNKIVFEYNEKWELIDFKYDLYNWSYTYLEYKNFTLKIVRVGHILYLIKSDSPLNIDLFEYDSASLIEKTKKWE